MMVLKIFLLFLMISVEIFPNYGHKCSYKPPDFNEVVTHVTLDSDGERVKRSTFSSLRIKAIYDSSIMGLTPEKQDYVRKILIPHSVGFWERLLSVRRSSAPIKLERRCPEGLHYRDANKRISRCAGYCLAETRCGAALVPEEHLLKCRYCLSSSANTCRDHDGFDGPGMHNADFVLYVTSVDSERCQIPDTLAYAAHCQLEATLDRPIAGHVNLCPQSISPDHRDQEILLSTVKHEILHALAFSSGLYAYFRDDQGRPRTQRNVYGDPLYSDKEAGHFLWSSNTIKTIERPEWMTRSGKLSRIFNLVVTPRVVSEVRRHFNCTSLEGAEVEDQGGLGTAITHWEKRIFENEAMTGTHTQNPVYSRITLALIEDSGWYKANYSLAMPLHWGKNLGCDFAQKSCADWIENRMKKGLSTEPFCTRVRQFNPTVESPIVTSCTDRLDSVALCNLVKFQEPLPAIYQNLIHLNGYHHSELQYYGGSVELADYCPYNQEFTWSYDTSERRDTRCELESNNYLDPDHNTAMEIYGPNSKCLYHNSPWVKKSCSYTQKFKHYGSGCYEIVCSEGRVWVNISRPDGHLYPCYHQGQIMVINQMDNQGWSTDGSIICPPCQELCQTSTSIFRCLPDQNPPPNPVGDKNIEVPCGAQATGISFSLQLLSILIFYFL